MTPRGDPALDHRLLVALDEAPDVEVPLTICEGEGVVWAGFDTPRRTWERLAPDQRALAGRIQLAGGPPEGEGRPVCGEPIGEAESLVAVVDHVPDLRHPDLEGRVRAVHLMGDGRTWRPGEPPPPPGPTHHGTCSVGAALAAGADHCEVWCPATWQEAAGWELHPGHVADALVQITLGTRPEVVLLALERHGDGPRDPLRAAVRRVLEHDIQVVAAAGNHPGLHAAWDTQDATVAWSPRARDVLTVWCFDETPPTVSGTTLRPRDGRPGDLQHVEGAVVSLLGSGPAVLSVTASEPLELTLPGRCRVQPPFPEPGELRIRGWHRGRGSVGSPARVQGVYAVGVEGLGASGLDEQDRPVRLLAGPGRLRVPRNGGGYRSFSGTSAAAAHVAGLCAGLRFADHSDPWAELSRMLQA